jgi:hypothetical protein
MRNVRLGAGSGVGSGAVILNYGFAEPEPKELFTAPQHCPRDLICLIVYEWVLFDYFCLYDLPAYGDEPFKMFILITDL